MQVKSVSLLNVPTAHGNHGQQHVAKQHELDTK